MLVLAEQGVAHATRWLVELTHWLTSPASSDGLAHAGDHDDPVLLDQLGTLDGQVATTVALDAEHLAVSNPDDVFARLLVTDSPGESSAIDTIATTRADTL